MCETDVYGGGGEIPLDILYTAYIYIDKMTPFPFAAASDFHASWWFQHIWKILVKLHYFAK